MSEKMTLEKVRDVLRNAGRYDLYGTDLQACDLADAIDAHLTQPAQAVDVGAIREVLSAMRKLDPRFKSFCHDRWVDKLTAALPKDSNDGD